MARGRPASLNERFRDQVDHLKPGESTSMAKVMNPDLYTKEQIQATLQRTGAVVRTHVARRCNDMKIKVNHARVVLEDGNIGLIWVVTRTDPPGDDDI